MSLERIRARFGETGFARELRAVAGEVRPGSAIRVRGAVGSTPAFVIAEAHSVHGDLLVAVLPEHESAAYLQSDLEQIVDDGVNVLAFPPSGNDPYDHEQVPESGPVIARVDVLQQLREGFRGIIVTSAEALAERVAPPGTVERETMTVQTGETHPPEELLERLDEQGFEVVEFVEVPGEVALRGGILDVYPFAGDYPIRIEYFGDEIDSIREFDPATQRSVSRRTHARLVPDLGAGATSAEDRIPLTEHLPDDTLLALFDSKRFSEVAGRIFEEASIAHARGAEGSPGSPPPPPDRFFLSPSRLEEVLVPFPRILLGTFSPDGDRSIELDAQPQPPFNSDVRRLRAHLAELRRDGFEAHLMCDSPSQRGRLRELLAEPDEEPDARLSVESLHEGFVLPDARLAVFTDHQVFNRYHRPTARKRRRVSGGLSLRDIQGLTPGDFVVHVDHGVGRFTGLHRIRVRETVQEAVRLEFLGGDELFVNVGALHKLHKYTGKEGHQPRLTKLGSGQWERVKSRTKKRVKDIARDLIKIYARRKAAPGLAFAPDSTWQREMEASFQYEDTPDQAAAAAAVKEDMEQPTPMDRLVCGDVGFGKTEIAVRAAFKAVQDGRQVAVLVPTTLLAMQHFATFSERLDRYPVRIAQLSRLVTPGEQKEVLDKLASGEVDVVIGTQRLAGKKVRFKDLGLLVIDEEQRFGVTVKERLRKMRAEVDTLTLTATPIPRTLQFSLLGVRDLSIINTPPPNRQPVQTEIHTFDQDLIRDAILYEANRGGQVFFIHNRVQTIDEMAAMLRAMVPDVRVRVAHGQMKAAELEAVMRAFIERRFDVLVATNIVESGLDIANANTMIINRAERFGLSDLHQLRGRVGRSDVKAFCYLLVPSIHTLTREARMRLQAVEEFADLGSGFSIAMRDLDIRGAGALLGAEQSGFIQDLGYETYHKILEEAVAELREEEFADLFEKEDVPPVESVIEVEVDALIPATYVSNSTERMNLYRRLADVREEEKLDLIRQELVDRFGPPPAEVEALLTSAAMRPLAESLRLPKVTFKNQRLFLTLPDSAEDARFYDQDFQPLLARLEGLDRRYVLKENRRGRLRAIVQQVPTLAIARDVLEMLQAGAAVEA